MPSYLFRLSTGSIDEVEAAGLQVGSGVTKATDATRRYLSFAGGSGDAGIGGTLAALPLGDPDLTLCAWIRFPEAVPVDPAAVIDLGTASGMDRACVMVTSGVYAYVGSFNDWHTGISPVIGRWVHVVLTKLGQAVELHLDGKLVARGTLPQTTRIQSRQLGVGRSSAGEPFRGDLGEIVVYDRVLAPAEIARLATP